MENGEVEQVDTGAEDSQGSFTDDQSNGDVPEDGALEGQVTGEGDQFDRNSPEARYWQSQHDKAIGGMQAKVARLEAQIGAGRIGQTQEPQGPNLDEIVNVAGFQPPQKAVRVLEERGLDGEAIGALVEILGAFGGHTLNGVNSYNQKAFAQQQQQSAAQAITKFVSEHGDRGNDILRIYDEMPDVAQRNPERFIRIVRAELGLTDPNAKQTPVPPKRGLATAISSSSTRPTRNGNAPARKPEPTSLRDSVSASIDDYMRRTGRQQ